MIESLAQYPHEELAVRSGQQVFCRDGHAGHVTLLLLDPRGQVRQFVMRLGYLGHEAIIPVDWVSDERTLNPAKVGDIRSRARSSSSPHVAQSIKRRCPPAAHRDE